MGTIRALEAGDKSLAQRLRVRLRLNEGEMSAFGSERSFDMPIGGKWAAGEPLRGYYIDFRNKCETPDWPPYWMGMGLMSDFHVAVVQWGLGTLERYGDGEGEAWLQGARDAAEYLLEQQQSGGPQDGGWLHLVPMPHSYRLDPPWISGIVQGEAASFFARLHLQTGEERYADAARRSLKPMLVAVSEGGAFAHLEGSPLVEEYPTDVPSWVLNGAIFALWGFHDVATGLSDEDAKERFETLTASLSENLWRFDTGFWSRYDIYPHPISNVASPAYHALHIKQLKVLGELSGRPELEQAARRFEGYRGSRLQRSRAMAQKIVFRLLVPRNALLAHRLPWNRSARSKRAERRRGTDVIVLSYHAVSPDWTAALSVTPERFAEQLRYLSGKGYRGVTFRDAVLGGVEGKAVAVTFDDGYRSVYELARPLLESVGMPATVFVATGFMDKGEPMAWDGIDHWLGTEHERELLPMSWQQARSLAEAGWEIGSHTRSHPHLPELSGPMLDEELAGSRRDCEQAMQRGCETLAFPYGEYSADVVAATATAGYSAAATLPADSPKPSALQWPRVGIYHNDGGLSFRLKVSPLVRRLRGGRLWPALMGLLRRARPPEA
jgi:peptidoglycan/xylan/chitin deacetylase (PgdA/CDA1 family)